MGRVTRLHPMSTCLAVSINPLPLDHMPLQKLELWAGKLESLLQVADLVTVQLPLSPLLIHLERVLKVTAVMGPSPIFGLQVIQLVVTNSGQNYTIPRANFNGGLSFESQSFEGSAEDPDGAVLKTEFLSLGGGFFWKFAERSLPPYKGEWTGPMPGEYHQFIIAYDNAGNISTSEKMVQSVINPLAPVVELAPADLAKAQAIIESNGSISSIVIGLQWYWI